MMLIHLVQGETGGGLSDILTWVILFFVFIFAIDKNPELLLYIIYFAVGLFALTALFKKFVYVGFHIVHDVNKI